VQAGKSAQSFNRLDKQDAIVSCTLANQQQKLIERFLQLVKANHSTVAVSQNWSEIHKVNEQVRDRLKAHGLVGQEETAVTALERLDLMDAQKRDARSYTPDSVVVINGSVSGYIRLPNLSNQRRELLARWNWGLGKGDLGPFDRGRRTRQNEAMLLGVLEYVF
jgi:hypothetical protein